MAIESICRNYRIGSPEKYFGIFLARNFLGIKIEYTKTIYTFKIQCKLYILSHKNIHKKKIGM